MKRLSKALALMKPSESSEDEDGAAEESDSEEEDWLGMQVPLSASSSDGLVLAMACFQDPELVNRYGSIPSLLQLVFALCLHFVNMALQFGIMLGLLVTTVHENADPFRVGLNSKIDAVSASVAEQKPLGTAGEVEQSALELCRAKVTLPWSRFFILVLWSTKMTQELVDAIWRFIIIRKMPLKHLAADCLILEGKDRKESIFHLTPCIKAVSFTFVCLPEFSCAFALWWTGSKFLFFAKGMNTLLMNALSLAFITQLDELMFAAFASFRFKNRLRRTSYTYHDSRPHWHWSMWGTSLTKALLVTGATLYIYYGAFGKVTQFRHLCDAYFRLYPEHWSEFGREPLSQTLMEALGPVGGGP